MFAGFLIDVLCRDGSDVAQVLPIRMPLFQPVDGIRRAAFPLFDTPMPRMGCFVNRAGLGQLSVLKEPFHIIVQRAPLSART
jgi:hypothetical protein